MSDEITKPPKIVVINSEKIILNNPEYYRKQQKNWLFKMPQALYRNSIFLPVSQIERKISHESKKNIEINNLCKFDLYYPVLNQTHANIIDAILYNAIRYIVVEDNLWVIIALQEVMNTLHCKDYSWLSKKIKEIQEAIFIAYDPVVKENQGFPIKQMPLITYVDIFKGVAQDKYIGFQKTYAPYRVFAFSPLFLYLINNSYMITFPKSFIPKIIDLKYPINQAIVRYCLGSVNVNERLERLLIKLNVAGVVNGKIHRILKYRYFSNIKEEQDKLFEYFNIEIKPLKNQELGVLRRIGKDDVVRLYNANKLQQNSSDTPRIAKEEE